MTPTENVFIVVTSIVLLILAIWIKKINWEKLGFIPKPWWNGWFSALVFSVLVFVLVQLAIAYKFVDLPNWILDKDPILPLLVIVFLQEIIFRGLLISLLERWGRQKALWISVIIFVMFHLMAPYTWSSAGLIFAGLTFVGGDFYGWHFLKFRNIYLLTISHLILNLSCNYLIFQFLVK